MRKLFVAGLLFLHILAYAQVSSPEQQARELIAKMSLEEKASLMMHPSAPIEALGIPAYDWWNEALHGVARNGKATVFPMPIAMAASFDEPLVNEVFTAVSDEARVKKPLGCAVRPCGPVSGTYFLDAQYQHFPGSPLGPWHGNLRGRPVPHRPAGYGCGKGPARAVGRSCPQGPCLCQALCRAFRSGMEPPQLQCGCKREGP
jgi:Glycosyl hydrolase family 3 N terminal domain.